MGFLEYLEKTCPGDDAHDGLGDARPLLERCSMCQEIYQEHRKEVDRLEHIISEKPDVTPPIPGEYIEKFQRLWEACIGLAEKADFKVIFRYAHKIELEAHDVREIVLRHKEWLVSMAGLDNSPEAPGTLRSGLLKLVEIAERKR